jgi:hypothetical protein
MQFPRAAIALLLSSVLAACGNSAPTGGPGAAQDASSSDGSSDASSDAPLDGAVVTPVDATASGSDGAPSEDATAPADGSDAAPVAIVLGCAAGSQTVTMTSGNVTVAYDLTAGVATFSYAALPKVTGFYAGVQLSSYITSKDYPTHTCATSS